MRDCADGNGGRRKADQRAVWVNKEIWLLTCGATVKGKSRAPAPVQEDDEEAELRKLQAEMAMPI